LTQRSSPHAAAARQRQCATSRYGTTCDKIWQHMTHDSGVNSNVALPGCVQVVAKGVCF
jgi:hypothetical protein